MSDASALRSESIRASNIAAGQAQVDVGVFVEILTSRAHGDEKLARYLERRARQEFRPALAAWDRNFASGDGDGEAARATTPFELPEYRLAARDEANRLRIRADETLTEAHRANSIGTAYAMPTVLFSTVLFLAGIAPKLYRTAARAILIVAGVVLVASTVIVVLVPKVVTPSTPRASDVSTSW